MCILLLTTSTVSIKVMEDYSSSLFLQCFICLSCEVGYPKKLLLWISKKTWWRKSTNHWMWLYENRLPRCKISTTPAHECRLWAMSNCGSSHVQENRAKNLADQRINSKNNHERATINTSMGDSSCWNLEFHQQSTFSHWRHNWWPWKSWPDNTKSITAWTEQHPKSNGIINC